MCHANAEPYVDTEDAENLQLWAMRGYNNSLPQLPSVKFLSRWTNRPIVKGKTSCTCIQGRYFSPNPDAIPDVLKNLSNSEICSLRPLTVHCGQYTRLPNGYRQKSGTFRLTCCKLSVLEQIEKLDNQPSQLRALAAYK